MHDTSLSLLARLRVSPESDAWNRLVGLYTPWLRAWLRQHDVQASDADDLIQDVLLAVCKDLKNFEHVGQPGAFRGWLKAILVNRLRNSWRARGRRPLTIGDADGDLWLAQLEDPASQMSHFWDRQHDQHVARQLLALVEPQFASQTWRAFRRVALEGVPADAVAEELRISVNAVFIAKSRVLSRLRQEAEGLIESSAAFLGKS